MRNRAHSRNQLAFWRRLLRRKCGLRLRNPYARLNMKCSVWACILYLLQVGQALKLNILLTNPRFGIGDPIGSNLSISRV